jgi:hypothetical protein
MVDPRSPNRVVALLFQRNAAGREVHTKITLHEYHHGGALVVSRPIHPFVPERVNSPFHLYIFAGPHARGLVYEMAEYPATVS